jgi:hypothetical protein
MRRPTGRAATSRIGPIDQAGAMPTTRQASTSTSIGQRIQRGGSCGARGRSGEGLPNAMSAEKRSA